MKRHDRPDQAYSMVDLVRGPDHRGGRRRYWTKRRIAKVLREWSDAHGGKAPSWAGWSRRPNRTTILAVFGSWNAAMIYAGITPNPQHVTNIAEDSDYLQARIDAGETLGDVAADLGISGQALGRRLKRYRERNPEVEHTVPYQGWRKRRDVA